MTTDHAAGRALRVLVVEDHRPEADLVVEALAGIGLTECRIADSVVAAHRLLDEWPPDLVLLDLGLPDGDGLDVLSLLGRGGRMGVPVIVVTGAADAERRVLALEAGAHDVVVKPFDLLELGARARRALRDHVDLEAASTLARAMASELAEVTELLDERASVLTDRLVTALRLRSPALAAHADLVADRVREAAERMGIGEVAARFADAARAHAVGALTMDDRDLAGVLAGDPAALDLCRQRSLELLVGHDRLAAAAARCTDRTAEFVLQAERVLARLTADAHTGGPHTGGPHTDGTTDTGDTTVLHRE